ncbi:MAG: diphosphatase [Solirubrobacterales bacterium]|nr:diphosphatase [Solirubrobacterales bacterium]
MPAAANIFAGATLDRAAPHRADEGWMAQRLADPAARALLLGEDGPLVVDGEAGARPLLVPLSAVSAAEELVFLGLGREGPVFAADAARASGYAPDRARPIGLRVAGAQLHAADAGLVAYAAGLLNWHRAHRFCARCGAPTRVAEAGHLRICPRCGAHHHPRTDPVVIMLVHDGDRVLLGRQPTWPERRYSALAGFVEPGESLEEAVVREVREESGVEIAEPAYSSSQPWPFPSSLMLGFHARYAGGEPEVRDLELEDVRWFRRDEVAAAMRGEGPLDVPPPIAIARRLIEEWLSDPDI